MPATLFDALADAFRADPLLVAATGHDEADGPHKLWRDAVHGAADGPGVAVPPPYVVLTTTGDLEGGMTFRRNFSRAAVVLVKSFAEGAAEAEGLGELVAARLFDPSRDRPRHRWETPTGPRVEVACEPLAGARLVQLPGRGVSGRLLHGHYARFALLYGGEYRYHQSGD